MRIATQRLLATAAAVTLVAGTATATTVIYQENFGGGAADLNGITPDVGTNDWVANSDFDADGSVSGASTGGSATLAFTPVDGLVYTLDVSLGASTYASSPDNDWFAVGFANGQSTADGSGERFINNNVIGKAWMLQRGPGPITNGGTNQSFLGSATSGTQNGAAWEALDTQFGGDIDLRIVLDTTLGAGSWNVTFFAKPTADATYQVVRSTENLANEDIDSVGVARSSGDISGSITSFSLTSVPEPGSLALLGLGSLLVARRRRG
ncbi:MAG: PEP-CTERM sorting domain-containing protein [Planctomycetota bacterium]